MAEIYIAYSGRDCDRRRWDAVDDDESKVRAVATMLYVAMRSQQESAGNAPTAGVWIGHKPFEPTLEELMANDTRAKLVGGSEGLLDEMAVISITVPEDELEGLVDAAPTESALDEPEPPDLDDWRHLDLDL